jgi:GNAT superfamily N-acetyltransferase
MSQIAIELAKPGDGMGIDALVRECFTPKQRELFIYGCSGAIDYVEDGIAYQERGGDSAFIVARGTRILGFVEVRRLADAVCLNYMATSGDARGQGIYRRLMAAAVELGQREGVADAVHDVFVGNTIKQFHERIGYRVTKHLVWRSAVVPDRPPGWAVLVGAPQGDAVHRRFGFSQIQVVTRRGRYDVGRLGASWYRRGSPEVLAERRRLLVIAPSACVLPTDLPFQTVLESERLEGQIADVLPGLRGDHGA